ncbi:helix-turn-helix domain-containing protein [Sphingorhabdus sp. EL138]|uniref:helix-turn-helix domain-containing protein n=1 Tax=Sphingorhabdus sp. EL138 TaxID=2073156 RepID=UPI0013A5BB57|nr:helix-turn-helix domain-containing protein [Sphingorhabdus sp. EL138]
MQTEFGSILKEWRKLRRFSQLDLSLEADMSARHLSFLESGRSNPSRAMVLRLSEALKLPRGTANQALNAAGFAAIYPSLPDDAPELAPVHQAIATMLDHHDPYPGIAVDRHWNVVRSNKGSQMLLALAGPGQTVNLMEVLIKSAEMDLIENWDEVAMLSLTRLRTEILELGGDEKLSALMQRVSDLDRVKNADLASINLNQAVIPTILRVGENRLSLFSTISQFGSVQDTQAGETRIELMFPMDDETIQFFER